MDENHYHVLVVSSHHCLLIPMVQNVAQVYLMYLQVYGCITYHWVEIIFTDPFTLITRSPSGPRLGEGGHIIMVLNAEYLIKDLITH